MKSIFRAIGLLSGASAVSLVLGLISAKLTALWLGPAGVGFLGLLQSTTGLAVLVATMGGVSAGMVRLVSRAIAANDAREEAAARTATWLLCAAFSAVTVAIMLGLRVPLARAFLGSADRADAILPLALAVVLTLVTSVQTNLLSAHQRVADIARINIWNSVLGPALLLPLIWIWHEASLPWAVFAGSVATAAVSRAYVARRVGPSPARAGRAEIARASGELLRFGIPVNMSSLAGSGVQLAMPVLVLHALGHTDVGFYRAAAGVSMTYLGFLLSALGQDYYPRLSACGGEPARVRRLINDQARAMLLVAGPFILIVLALARYLVPLIYTPQFRPAVPLLEWQLIGDVLKVAGWTMGFAILARLGGVAYLGVEIINGVTLLVCSWTGVRVLGLEGLGVGFLVSSGVTFAVYWTVLRRSIDLRLTRHNTRLICGFLVAAVVIRTLPHLGLGLAGTVLGVSMALIGSLWSLKTIWTDIGGWPRSVRP